MTRCELCSTDRRGKEKTFYNSQDIYDNSPKAAEFAEAKEHLDSENLFESAKFSDALQVLYHPKAMSQFTEKLPNACALLAIKIACKALTTNCLSWDNINKILKKVINPPQNAQVSHAIENGALKEKVTVLTEVIPDLGLMGCTNGLLEDVKSSLESAGKNAVAAIITTGATTFTVFRIHGKYLVVDTHSFHGKGMVVKAGNSFASVVENHFQHASTSAAGGMLAKALEYVVLAPVNPPREQTQIQPQAKLQGQPRVQSLAKPLAKPPTQLSDEKNELFRKLVNMLKDLSPDKDKNSIKAILHELQAMVS